MNSEISLAAMFKFQKSVQISKTPVTRDIDQGSQMASKTSRPIKKVVSGNDWRVI